MSRLLCMSIVLIGTSVYCSENQSPSNLNLQAAHNIMKIMEAFDDRFEATTPQSTATLCTILKNEVAHPGRAYRSQAYLNKQPEDIQDAIKDVAQLICPLNGRRHLSYACVQYLTAHLNERIENKDCITQWIEQPTFIPAEDNVGYGDAPQCSDDDEEDSFFTIRW